MRIYIAARFSRREEAGEVAAILTDLGHSITSSWIWQPASEMYREDGPNFAGEAAQKDLDEVESSDTLVYLSEMEDNIWGRGGRHVEFGAALAFRKDVWVIGPMENLFHYLQSVLHFDCLDDLVQYMQESETAE